MSQTCFEIYVHVLVYNYWQFKSSLNKFKLYQQLLIVFCLQLVFENNVLTSSSLVMYTTKMFANDKIGYNNYVRWMSPCSQVSISWKNKANLRLCYVFASSKIDKTKPKISSSLNTSCVAPLCHYFCIHLFGIQLEHDRTLVHLLSSTWSPYSKNSFLPIKLWWEKYIFDLRISFTYIFTTFKTIISFSREEDLHICFCFNMVIWK